MESKILEGASPSAPSYEEATKPVMHPYPDAMMHEMMQKYQPMTVSQPPPMIHNINIGGLSATCDSCRKPLHTRLDYVSTCSTHCGFLFCCLFLCWPCAPFIYCTKSCREPRLFCVNCGKRI